MWSVTGAISKQLCGVIAASLDRYVEGLNPEQLGVSLWSGQVELRNLKLRLTLFDAIAAESGTDPAFQLVEGRLGILRVTVPWASLASEPMSVTVDGVDIAIAPLAATGGGPASTGDEEADAESRRFEAQLRTKAETAARDAILSAFVHARDRVLAAIAAPSVNPSGPNSQPLSPVAPNQPLRMAEPSLPSDPSVFDAAKATTDGDLVASLECGPSWMRSHFALSKAADWCRTAASTLAHRDAAASADRGMLARMYGSMIDNTKVTINNVAVAILPSTSAASAYARQQKRGAKKTHSPEKGGGAGDETPQVSAGPVASSPVMVADVTDPTLFFSIAEIRVVAASAPTAAANAAAAAAAASDEREGDGKTAAAPSANNSKVPVQHRTITITRLRATVALPDGSRVTVVPTLSTEIHLATAKPTKQAAKPGSRPPPSVSATIRVPATDVVLTPEAINGLRAVLLPAAAAQHVDPERITAAPRTSLLLAPSVAAADAGYHSAHSPAFLRLRAASLKVLRQVAARRQLMRALSFRRQSKRAVSSLRTLVTTTLTTSSSSAASAPDDEATAVAAAAAGGGDSAPSPTPKVSSAAAEGLTELCDFDSAATIEHVVFLRAHAIAELEFEAALREVDARSRGPVKAGQPAAPPAAQGGGGSWWWGWGGAKGGEPGAPGTAGDRTMSSAKRKNAAERVAGINATRHVELEPVAAVQRPGHSRTGSSAMVSPRAAATAAPQRGHSRVNSAESANSLDRNANPLTFASILERELSIAGAFLNGRTAPVAMSTIASGGNAVDAPKALVARIHIEALNVKLTPSVPHRDAAASRAPPALLLAVQSVAVSVDRPEDPSAAVDDSRRLDRTTAIIGRHVMVPASTDVDVKIGGVDGHVQLSSGLHADWEPALAVTAKAGSRNCVRVHASLLSREVPRVHGIARAELPSNHFTVDVGDVKAVLCTPVVCQDLARPFVAVLSAPMATSASAAGSGALPAQPDFGSADGPRVVDAADRDAPPCASVDLVLGDVTVAVGAMATAALAEQPMLAFSVPSTRLRQNTDGSVAASVAGVRATLAVPDEGTTTVLSTPSISVQQRDRQHAPLMATFGAEGADVATVAIQLGQRLIGPLRVIVADLRTVTESNVSANAVQQQQQQPNSEGGLIVTHPFTMSVRVADAGVRMSVAVVECDLALGRIRLAKVTAGADDEDSELAGRYASMPFVSFEPPATPRDLDDDVTIRLQPAARTVDVRMTRMLHVHLAWPFASFIDVVARTLGALQGPLPLKRYVGPHDVRPKTSVTMDAGVAVTIGWRFMHNDSTPASWCRPAYRALILPLTAVADAPAVRVAIIGAETTISLGRIAAFDRAVDYADTTHVPSFVPLLGYEPDAEKASPSAVTHQVVVRMCDLLADDGLRAAGIASSFVAAIDVKLHTTVPAAATGVSSGPQRMVVRHAHEPVMAVVGPLLDDATGSPVAKVLMAIKAMNNGGRYVAVPLTPPPPSALTVDVLDGTLRVDLGATADSVPAGVAGVAPTRLALQGVTVRPAWDTELQAASIQVGVVAVFAASQEHPLIPAPAAVPSPTKSHDRSNSNEGDDAPLTKPPQGPYGVTVTVTTARADAVADPEFVSSPVSPNTPVTNDTKPPKTVTCVDVDVHTSVRIDGVATLETMLVGAAYNVLFRAPTGSFAEAIMRRVRRVAHVNGLLVAVGVPRVDVSVQIAGAVATPSTPQVRAGTLRMAVAGVMLRKFGAGPWQSTQGTDLRVHGVRVGFAPSAPLPQQEQQGFSTFDIAQIGNVSVRLRGAIAADDAESLINLQSDIRVRISDKLEVQPAAAVVFAARAAVFTDPVAFALASILADDRDNLRRIAAEGGIVSVASPAVHQRKHTAVEVACPVLIRLVEPWGAPLANVAIGRSVAPGTNAPCTLALSLAQTAAAPEGIDHLPVKETNMKADVAIHHGIELDEFVTSEIAAAIKGTAASGPAERTIVRTTPKPGPAPHFAVSFESAPYAPPTWAPLHRTPAATSPATASLRVRSSGAIEVTALPHVLLRVIGHASTEVSALSGVMALAVTPESVRASLPLFTDRELLETPGLSTPRLDVQVGPVTATVPLSGGRQHPSLGNAPLRIHIGSIAVANRTVVCHGVMDRVRDAFDIRMANVTDAAGVFIAPTSSSSASSLRGGEGVRPGLAIDLTLTKPAVPTRPHDDDVHRWIKAYAACEGGLDPERLLGLAVHVRAASSVGHAAVTVDPVVSQCVAKDLLALVTLMEAHPHLPSFAERCAAHYVAGWVGNANPNCGTSMQLTVHPSVAIELGLYMAPEESHGRARFAKLFSVDPSATLVADLLTSSSFPAEAYTSFAAAGITIRDRSGEPVLRPANLGTNRSNDADSDSHVSNAVAARRRQIRALGILGAEAATRGFIGAAISESDGQLDVTAFRMAANVAPTAIRPAIELRVAITSEMPRALAALATPDSARTAEALARLHGNAAADGSSAVAPADSPTVKDRAFAVNALFSDVEICASKPAIDDDHHHHQTATGSRDAFSPVLRLGFSSASISTAPGTRAVKAVVGVMSVSVTTATDVVHVALVDGVRIDYTPAPLPLSADGSTGGGVPELVHEKIDVVVEQPTLHHHASAVTDLLRTASDLGVVVHEQFVSSRADLVVASPTSAAAPSAAGDGFAAPVLRRVERSLTVVCRQLAVHLPVATSPCGRSSAALLRVADLNVHQSHTDGHHRGTGKSRLSIAVSGATVLVAEGDDARSARRSAAAEAKGAHSAATHQLVGDVALTVGNEQSTHVHHHGAVRSSSALDVNISPIAVHLPSGLALERITAAGRACAVQLPASLNTLRAAAGQGQDEIELIPETASRIVKVRAPEIRFVVAMPRAIAQPLIAQHVTGLKLKFEEDTAVGTAGNHHRAGSSTSEDDRDVASTSSDSGGAISDSASSDASSNEADGGDAAVRRRTAQRRSAARRLRQARLRQVSELSIDVSAIRPLQAEQSAPMVCTVGSIHDLSAPPSAQNVGGDGPDAVASASQPPVHRSATLRPRAALVRVRTRHFLPRRQPKRGVGELPTVGVTSRLTTVLGSVLPCSCKIETKVLVGDIALSVDLERGLVSLADGVLRPFFVTLYRKRQQQRNGDAAGGVMSPAVAAVTVADGELMTLGDEAERMLSLGRHHGDANGSSTDGSDSDDTASSPRSSPARSPQKNRRAAQTRKSVRFASREASNNVIGTELIAADRAIQGDVIIDHSRAGQWRFVATDEAATAPSNLICLSGAHRATVHVTVPGHGMPDTNAGAEDITVPPIVIDDGLTVQTENVKFVIHFDPRIFAIALWETSSAVPPAVMRTRDRATGALLTTLRSHMPSASAVLQTLCVVAGDRSVFAVDTAFVDLAPIAPLLSSVRQDHAKEYHGSATGVVGGGGSASVTPTVTPSAGGSAAAQQGRTKREKQLDAAVREARSSALTRTIVKARVQTSLSLRVVADAGTSSVLAQPSPAADLSAAADEAAADGASSPQPTRETSASPSRRGQPTLDTVPVLVGSAIEASVFARSHRETVTISRHAAPTLYSIVAIKALKAPKSSDGRGSEAMPLIRVTEGGAVGSNSALDVPLRQPPLVLTLTETMDAAVTNVTCTWHSSATFASAMRTSQHGRAAGAPLASNPPQVAAAPSQLFAMTQGRSVLQRPVDVVARMQLRMVPGVNHGVQLPDAEGPASAGASSNDEEVSRHMQEVNAVIDDDFVADPWLGQELILRCVADDVRANLSPSHVLLASSVAAVLARCVKPPSSTSSAKPAPVTQPNAAALRRNQLAGLPFFSSNLHSGGVPAIAVPVRINAVVNLPGIAIRFMDELARPRLLAALSAVAIQAGTRTGASSAVAAVSCTAEVVELLPGATSTTVGSRTLFSGAIVGRAELFAPPPPIALFHPPLLLGDYARPRSRLGGTTRVLLPPSATAVTSLSLHGLRWAIAAPSAPDLAGSSHGKFLDVRADIGDVHVSLPLQSVVRVARAIDPWIKAVNVDATSAPATDDADNSDADDGATTEATTTTRDRRLLDDVFSVGNESGLPLRIIFDRTSSSRGSGGNSSAADSSVLLAPGDVVQFPSSCAYALALETVPGTFTTMLPSVSAMAGELDDPDDGPSRHDGAASQASTPRAGPQAANVAGGSGGAARARGDVAILAHPSAIRMAALDLNAALGTSAMSHHGLAAHLSDDALGTAREHAGRIPLRVAYSFAERTVRITSMIGFESRCPGFDVEMHSTTHLALQCPPNADISRTGVHAGGTFRRALEARGNGATGESPVTTTRRHFVGYGEEMASGLCVALRPQRQSPTTSTGPAAAAKRRPAAEWVSRGASVPSARSIASLQHTVLSLGRTKAAQRPDATTTAAKGADVPPPLTPTGITVDIAVPLEPRGAVLDAAPNAHGSVWMRCAFHEVPIVNPTDDLRAATCAAVIQCVFEPAFTIRSLLPNATALRFTAPPAVVPAAPRAEDDNNDDDDDEEQWFDIAGAGLPAAWLSSGSAADRAAQSRGVASALRYATNEHVRRSAVSARQAASVFSLTASKMEITTTATAPLAATDGEAASAEPVRSVEPLVLPRVRWASATQTFVVTDRREASYSDGKAAKKGRDGAAAQDKLTTLTAALADGIGATLHVAVDVDHVRHAVTLRPLGVVINRLPTSVRVHADTAAATKQRRRDAVWNEQRDVVGGLTTRRLLPPACAVLASASFLDAPGISIEHANTILPCHSTNADVQQALLVTGVTSFIQAAKARGPVAQFAVHRELMPWPGCEGNVGGSVVPLIVITPLASVKVGRLPQPVGPVAPPPPTLTVALTSTSPSHDADDDTCTTAAVGAPASVSALPSLKPALKLRLEGAHPPLGPVWSREVELGDVVAAVNDASSAASDASAEEAGAQSHRRRRRRVLVWLPAPRTAFSPGSVFARPIANPSPASRNMLEVLAAVTIELTASGAASAANGASNGSSSPNLAHAALGVRAAETGKPLLRVTVDVLPDAPVTIDNRTGFDVTVMPLTLASPQAAVRGGRATASSSTSGGGGSGIVHVGARKCAPLIAEGLQTTSAAASTMRIFVNDASEDSRAAIKARAAARLHTAREQLQRSRRGGGGDAAAVSGAADASRDQQSGWGWWPFKRGGGPAQKELSPEEAAADAALTDAQRAGNTTVTRWTRSHACATALPFAARTGATSVESFIQGEDFEASPSFVVDQPGYADISLPAGALAGAVDASSAGAVTALAQQAAQAQIITAPVTVFPSGASFPASTPVAKVSLELVEDQHTVVVVITNDSALQSTIAARTAEALNPGLRTHVSAHVDSFSVQLLSAINGTTLGIDAVAEAASGKSARPAFGGESDGSEEKPIMELIVSDVTAHGSAHPQGAAFAVSLVGLSLMDLSCENPTHPALFDILPSTAVAAANAQRHHQIGGGRQPVSHQQHTALTVSAEVTHGGRRGIMLVPSVFAACGPVALRLNDAALYVLLKQVSWATSALEKHAAATTAAPATVGGGMGSSPAASVDFTGTGSDGAAEATTPTQTLVQACFIAPIHISASLVRRSDARFNPFADLVGPSGSVLIPTVRDAPISLSAFAFDGSPVAPVVTAADLGASYAAAVRSQVAWQAYKVLGSIEILGNPTQLVSSVASGVRALATESMQLRPHVGVGKLLGHTATGVLRSLGSLSRLSARSVAALSLDSQWLSDLDREAAAANAAAGGWDSLRRSQQQRLRRANTDDDDDDPRESDDSPASGVRKPVTTVADSEATVVVHRASPDATAPPRRPKLAHKAVARGDDAAVDSRRSAFNHVARGVVDGVTGVVAQPVRGARRDGALGLAKGVAVGAVGLFARPIAGIFSGVGAAASSLADVTTIDADQDDPALAPAIVQPSAAMHRSRCARSIAPAAYRGGDTATTAAAESSRHRRFGSGGGMGRAMSSGFMSEATGAGVASGSVSPSMPSTPAVTPPVPLASTIVRAMDDGDDSRTDRAVEALYYEAQSVANTHDFARLLMKMFGLLDKNPAVRVHAADIAAAARDEALAHWVIEQAAAAKEHPEAASSTLPPVAGANSDSVARLVKLRAAYLHHKDGVASQLAKFAPLAQVAAVLSWGELLAEVQRQLDDHSHSEVTPRVAADLVVSAVVQTWRSTTTGGSAGSGRPFMV